MRRLILLTWALAMLAPSLFSADKTRVYSREYEVTGTAAAVTVQQPASAARALELRGVYFSCSLACTVTVQKNGTITGGSTVAAVSLDERGAASVSAVKTDATVASGTSVFTDDIAAEVKLAYGGSLYLPAVSSVQKSITASISAASSADLKIYLEWAEPQ